MTLFAAGVNAKPKDALLCDLDQRTFFVASIGDDNQIGFAERISGVCKQIGKAPAARGFFVRHEDKSDIPRSLHAFVEKGLGGEQRGDEVLLVVLDASSENPVFLEMDLIGIGFPKGQVSGRHDVRVGEDPGRIRRGTRGRHNHDDIGARPGGDALVGGRELANIRKTAASEILREKSGLAMLPVTPVFRSQRGNGREGGLQINHGPSIAVNATPNTFE